ncbi:MAG: 50S ribosomal protein L6 [Candidatus Absconditabacterales bacterium]
MSKVGKKPIEIPSGVEVSMQGDVITVKGPKGSLHRTVYPGVTVEIEGNSIQVSAEGYEMRKFWGLMRALIANMVIGVHTGYSKKMLVFGVGYTAKSHGSDGIEFTLGLSHKVQHKVPHGVTLAFEKDTKNNDIIGFTSIDKELLGETCARIRAIKPPEPYKGAGIRFLDEVIKLKPGKAASK